MWCLIRKDINKNFFLTLKQNKSSVIQLLLVSLLIVLCSSLFTYLTYEKVILDYDALAFQIILPGLDEEIAFRSIMIGLLLSSLRETSLSKRFIFFNPAILITSLLFGLAHGFPLTTVQLKFDYFSFGYTFIFGIIYGWMVIKSRSILIPILTHNLNNFFGF